MKYDISMGKLDISRSIQIDAPMAQVHAEVADFHNWPSWSPWLITEPEAQVDVREDGKYYTWLGNRTGQGNMEVRQEAPNRVDYNLEFLKPWKSKADVSFILKEANGGTNVTWTMKSGWPFFLFWMKKKTEAFISMDYDRGLNMLKTKLEQGNIPSKLSFGRDQHPGCTYIGIKREVPMSKLAEMSKDLISLHEHINAKGGAFAGQPFTQFHKWDAVGQKVTYTTAIPLQSAIEPAPGMTSGTLPAFDYAKITHQGPYDFLGNAWSAAMMMTQSKEIKQNKKIDPIEIYQNDPSQVAPEDILTDVCMPIKA